MLQKLKLKLKIYYVCQMLAVKVSVSIFHFILHRRTFARLHLTAPRLGEVAGVTIGHAGY